MRRRIFMPAVWIIPVLLLIAGVGYATKDKKTEPADAVHTPISTIRVTDQRATVVPSTQALLSASSDTLFGVSADWVDFSVGAIVCSSAAYGAAGSFGDANTGECSTSTYGAEQGVAVIVEGLCCVIPGDANSDDQVNVADAVFLVNYIFKGGPPPDCLDEGDANVDCSINVADAVYLINYIFKGGSAPECGCAE